MRNTGQEQNDVHEDMFEGIRSAILNTKQNPDPFLFLKSVTPDSRELYYSVEKSTDVLSINESIPVPAEISVHMSAASHNASFGAFPEYDFFYAIIDRKFFMWSSSTNGPCDQICEPEALITAACIAETSGSFLSDPVKQVLVVSTSTYIKIHPIIQNRLCRSNFFLLQTDFCGTSLCARTSQTGEVYVGGDDGHVHLLNLNYDAPILSNLTVSILGSIIPPFLKPIPKPIVKMVFEPSSSTLLTVDNESSVRFYRAGKSSLTQSTSFSPRKDTRFISFDHLPMDQSEKVRFILVDNKGTRYFFGGKSISLVASRQPPIELNNRNVFCATSGSYSTILTTEKSVVGIRNTNSGEIVALSAIKGRPIVCSSSSGSKVLLLTSEGSYIITVSGSEAVLQRLLGEKSNDETVSVLVGNNPEDALIIASKSPEKRSFAILALAAYAPDKAVTALATRAARLTKSLWNSPVLGSNVEVNIPELIDVAKIADELETKDIFTEEEFERVYQIKRTIMLEVEAIKLLVIISGQNADLIKSAVSRLNRRTRNRLTKLLCHNPTPVDDLGDFARSIIKSLPQGPATDLLAAKICREAPEICQVEISKLRSAKRSLRLARKLSESERSQLIASAFASIMSIHTEVPLDEVKDIIVTFTYLNQHEYAADTAAHFSLQDWYSRENGEDSA